MSSTEFLEENMNCLMDLDVSRDKKKTIQHLKLIKGMIFHFLDEVRCIGFQLLGNFLKVADSDNNMISWWLIENEIFDLTLSYLVKGEIKEEIEHIFKYMAPGLEIDEIRTIWAAARTEVYEDQLLNVHVMKIFTQITGHLRADVLEQIIEMVDVDINNHSLSDLHNDFLHVLSVIVKINSGNFSENVITRLVKFIRKNIDIQKKDYTIYVNYIIDSFRALETANRQQKMKAIILELNRSQEIVKLIIRSLSTSIEIPLKKDEKYKVVDNHLNLLKLLLKSGDLYLSWTHCEELWKCLGINGDLIIQDKLLCWFSECCSDLEPSTQKMLLDTKLMYVPINTLSVPLLKCLQTYINSVNSSSAGQSSTMYKNVICTILKTLAIKEKESFKGDHITQEQATQEQSEIEKLEKLANANSKKLKEMEKRSKLLSNKNDKLQQQIDDLINKKKVIEDKLIKSQEEKKTCAEIKENLKSMMKRNESARNNNPDPDMEVDNENNNFLEFLAIQIAAKESDLQCPVCLDTSQVPIYMCPNQHIICSQCWQRLRTLAYHATCAECRTPYSLDPPRHRYMEKVAQELDQLYGKFADLF